MCANPKKSLAKKFGKNQFYSLSLLGVIFLFLIGCISFDASRGEDPVNQEKLIETQLALIHNQIDNGQAKLALQSLRSIEKMYPDHSKILNTAGLVHLALNNTKPAISFLERAYAKNHETMIGLNLSSAYLADNRPKEARKLLLKLEKNKKYEFRERVYHNLGLSYEKERAYTQAIRSYNQALEQNPVFYKSALQLGKVFGHLKNQAQMVKHYVKAASFCPLCLDPIAELAKHYATQGDHTKASKIIAHFLKYKQITPQDKQEALALSSQITRL